MQATNPLPGVKRIDVLRCLTVFAATVTPTAPTPASPPCTDVVLVMGDVNPQVLFSDRRLVRVTGRWVHSDIVGKLLSFLPRSIQGHHIKSYTAALPSCYSVAVNPNETLMAVLCTEPVEEVPNTVHNRVQVYSLPDGVLLSTMADTGKEAGQLYNPLQVCFGADDCILVNSFGSNTVQAFTSAGAFKRSIAVQFPWSLCASASSGMIGVGGYEAVTILDSKVCESDGDVDAAVIRVIRNSKIKGYIDSVRFTPDDKFALVVPRTSGCAMQFSMSDGSLTRSFRCGAGPGYLCELMMTEEGEFVGVDMLNKCVNVCGSDGDELLMSWGGEAVPDPSHEGPTSLCYVNGRVYVLAANTRYIHVFE